MNYLIAYFLTGFVVFAWTFYRFVETGTFEKITESGTEAVGTFVLTSIGLHFLLWPLHVVMTALMLLSPRATQGAIRAFRREFVDRDTRFTQPQMRSRTPAVALHVREAKESRRAPFQPRPARPSRRRDLPLHPDGVDDRRVLLHAHDGADVRSSW
jgi:hypothetical protein